MKVTLFALFISLLMVGCGESLQPTEGVNMTDTAPKKDAMESAVEWSKLQNLSGVTYLPNTDKPFSGYAKRTYENDQVEVLSQFKDGYVVRVKQWQENGTPRWDVGFIEGNLGIKGMPWEGERNIRKFRKLFDGLATIWNENGQKEVQVNYREGRLDGLLTKWYENGKKMEEANFKGDKKNGLMTLWYKNGQKQEEENFKDGKQDGLSADWYENGQKRQVSNWKEGKLMSVVAWKPNGQKCPATNLKDGNGLKVGYYQNGQKKEEENWKDGIVDGLSTWWYENGQKAYESKLKGDKCLSAVTWKPNGDMCPMTNLSDGNGVWVWYNEDGNEQARATYQLGEPVDYVTPSKDIKRVDESLLLPGKKIHFKFRDGEGPTWTASFFENGVVIHSARPKGTYKIKGLTAFVVDAEPIKLAFKKPNITVGDVFSADSPSNKETLFFMILKVEVLKRASPNP